MTFADFIKKSGGLTTGWYKAQETVDRLARSEISPEMAAVYMEEQQRRLHASVFNRLAMGLPQLIIASIFLKKLMKAYREQEALSDKGVVRATDPETGFTYREIRLRPDEYQRVRDPELNTNQL
jgi:hypothetical protein